MRVEPRVPALVIGCGINSRYGLVVRGFEIAECGVKLVYRRRFKPPNHGRRRRMAAELQRVGRFGEANAARRRERALNEAWEKGVVAELRSAVRGYLERGYSVIVAVDAPDSGSLRGTELQGTLLRIVERLEWMCGFEGAAFLEVRVSGRRCPLCGSPGAEYEPRKYRCEKCGIRWQRDSMAAIAAALDALEELGLGEGAEVLRKWLREKAEKNGGDLTKL